MKGFGSAILFGLLLIALIVASFAVGVEQGKKSCAVADTTRFAHLKTVNDSLRTAIAIAQPKTDSVTDISDQSRHETSQIITRYRALPVLPYDSAYGILTRHARQFPHWAAALERRIDSIGRKTDSLRSIERRLREPAHQ